MPEWGLLRHLKLSNNSDETCLLGQRTAYFPTMEEPERKNMKQYHLGKAHLLFLTFTQIQI